MKVHISEEVHSINIPLQKKTINISSNKPIPSNTLYHNPPTNPPSLDSSSVPILVPLAVRLIDVCVHLMAHENTCHHSDHSIGRCLIYGAYADPVNSGCHSTASAGNAMRDPFDMLDPTGVKVMSLLPLTHTHPPPPYPTLPSLSIYLTFDSTNVQIGLCFMAPVCNISEQITCHRYKPRVTQSTSLPSARKDMTTLPRTTNNFLGTPSTHHNLYYRSGENVNGKIIIEPVKISSKKDYYKVFSSAFNGSFTDSFM